MHGKMCVIAALLIILSIPVIAQNSNANSLSLESAISKALENNPELQVMRHEVNALKASAIQEGLIPNPELSVDVENILGKDDLSGFKGSEITAALSQEIALAGKISKRVKVAEHNTGLAEWEYEIKKLEVITEVKKIFARALITNEIINKNYELINISEEFIANLTKRVNAGKISPAEVSRARIILNSLQIELNRFKSEYNSSIYELYLLISDPGLSIGSLEGNINYTCNLPGYDLLKTMLDNNPKLKKYKSEFGMRRAVIDLEEARSIPNLTLTAGLKHISELKANTFVVGASIPLPVFDRNQGNIQEAVIRLDQKKTEYDAAKNRLTLRLNLLYNRYLTLLNTSEQLKTESIPDAEKSFQIIKEGNLLGGFTILDVLDTERTVFELQNQYLSVIGELMEVTNEIESLTAYEIN